MEPNRPKMLGRYEIVSELGRGAMGTVYKAWDPKIERFAAIKTILLHQSGIHEQREFRSRFFVEAQAAGRLLHPGIVTLFDVGEEPGTSDPYIVMEYIEGPTLRDLLSEKGNKLPLDHALRIALEVAEALDYAHEQRVVHRDIKPANILITKQGQAKIGDFGIAQLDLTHLTVPGRVFGTPAFMSPEQLEGQQVDGRSDLFSLGAILYSALTGFSPFQGNSATTVCFKVANREPLQATALDPELPAELDPVIARALAKVPAERYQRGTEFASALRELLERGQGHGKGKLWFSPSDGRSRFLDATLKIAIAPAKPAVAGPASGSQRLGASSAASGAALGSLSRQGKTGRPTSSRALSSTQQTPPARPAPSGPHVPALQQREPAIRSRRVVAMFSSPRAQTGAAITMFVAALLLSFFSWWQMRTPRLAPANAVEPRTQAKAVENAPQKQISQASPTGSGHQAATEIKNEPDTPAAAPIEKAAAPARSKTLARPPHVARTPVVRTPADSVDVTHAAAKLPVATVTKSASKSAVVAPAANAGANANQTAAAAPLPVAVSADSNLEIRVENHFSDATLSVWVDDHLAYEHALHDGHKKRLILLGGGAREKLSIPVSGGHHALRIQVRSAADEYDESKTIAGEFPKGGQQVVSINFEKHTREMRLALGTE